MESGRLPLPIMNRFHQDEKALHQAGVWFLFFGFLCCASVLMLPLLCFVFQHLVDVANYEQISSGRKSSPPGIFCLVFFALLPFLCFPFCSSSVLLFSNIWLMLTIMNRFHQAGLFVVVSQEQISQRLDSVSIHVCVV